MFHYSQRLVHIKIGWVNMDPEVQENDGAEFCELGEVLFGKDGKVGTLITLPGEEPAVVVKSHVGGEHQQITVLFVVSCSKHTQTSKDS